MNKTILKLTICFFGGIGIGYLLISITIINNVLSPFFAGFIPTAVLFLVLKPFSD